MGASDGGSEDDGPGELPNVAPCSLNGGTGGGISWPFDPAKGCNDGGHDGNSGNPVTGSESRLLMSGSYLMKGLEPDGKLTGSGFGNINPVDGVIGCGARANSTW